MVKRGLGGGLLLVSLGYGLLLRRQLLGRFLVSLGRFLVVGGSECLLHSRFLI